MNYILLDAATMEEEIAIAKALNPNFQCLYLGKKAIELGTVAPFLFSIKPKSPFFDWIITHKDRDKWGIFLHSDKDFKTVWRHFRKFLIVKTETGKRLFFRFYDPRVLAPFLQTCDNAQLKALFGPINSFLYYSKEEGERIMRLNQNGGLDIL